MNGNVGDIDRVDAAPPVIDVLTVGETMCVMSPANAEPATAASTFRMDVGGAESNVAAHVAAMGLRARWHSRLGADALGDRVLRDLAGRGIDVSSVVRDAGRPTGLYLKDPGNGVLYYRKGSAASALDQVEAEALSFVGVRVLHVSGITAALSPTAAEFVDVAMQRATDAGVIVSMDVNYRKALWEVETAAPHLERLAARAGMLFVGRDEAAVLWGTDTDDSVRARFPDVAELVVKDDAIGATAYVGDERTFVPSPKIDVIDAVGAGDAFAGGYLVARLSGADARASLESGHARAARTLRSAADVPDSEGES